MAAPGLPTLAPTLSIVIPCWNDAESLAQILETIGQLRGIAEVIVADASEDSRCRTVAANAGAKVAECAQPNRGSQMNAGAGAARGEVLLFQHADTALTQAHVDSLLSAMRNLDIVGGAFHRKFDARHPLLRWLEPIARLLNRLGSTLYGDQSIFARREHFEKLGGFAAIP